MKMTTSNNITKRDLNRVFWRSFGMEWSWNYERQQNVAFAYSLIPIIEKLYKSDRDRAAALKRHLEFFNTTPHLSTLVLGIVTSMEEKNAEQEDFDVDTINSIKLSLMGPLA